MFFFSSWAVPHPRKTPRHSDLAPCIHSAMANRQRLLCSHNIESKTVLFGLRPPDWRGREGGRWLTPKPTSVPAKNHRERFVMLGASFGVIPWHNACLYLSISSRNISLWFSQQHGFAHRIHRCRMVVLFAPIVHRRSVNLNSWRSLFFLSPVRSLMSP